MPSRIRKCQAEIVEGLTVGRVGISLGHARNRCAKALFGKQKLTSPQMPATKRGIGAAVQRVPPNSLPPVILCLPGRMTILFQVNTCKKEFIAGFYVARMWWLCGDLRPAHRRDRIG